MSTLYLVGFAFYTLFIVGGVYYYESKIKDLQGAIEDYKRAINLARSNSNYAQLQIEHNKLLEDYALLDQEFQETYNAYCNISDLALQYKELWNKAVEENEPKKQESQYEYSTYKSDIWGE